MTQAANLSALGSNATTSGNLSSASTLTLQTNSTTAVTVDSSQNVGIGTSSPTWKTTIVNGTTPRCLQLSQYALSTTQDKYSFMSGAHYNSSTYTDGISMIGTSAGVATNAVWIGGGIGEALASTQIAFFTAANTTTTAGTERMRIDSSGNVLIGRTSQFAQEKLSISGSVAAELMYMINSNASPYGFTIYYSGSAPNGSSNAFMNCVDSGPTTRFTLKSNGGINNYSANNTNLSDVREKTNIELAGNYLDKICAIPVKTFNYIDQNMEEDGGLTLGVIAQDVQAVAPELVMESNWGTDEEPKERLSIYQTDLQYALMKSIQELKAIVDAQQQEINALKG